MGKSIVYTLKTCPTCNQLKKDWSSRGLQFEERQVDGNQSWLNEALKYADVVPIVVHEDGRIETGHKGVAG